MSLPQDFSEVPLHVVVFPSAGMGHLNPHLRLAAMLASRRCAVTVITAEPPLSTAESTHISTFFSTHPHIKRLKFEVVPNTSSKTTDPFFIRWEAIHNSAHLLPPLFSSLSPPISAIFSDVVVLAGTIPVSDDLGIPNFTLVATSARFFSFLANLPFCKPGTSVSDVPGLAPYTLSSIPPPFFNPDSHFGSMAKSHAQWIPKSTGLVMNTFHEFEPETIAALSNGRVLRDLPPVFPIGPLESLKKGCDSKAGNHKHISWLDSQVVGSVVYVSFGNRTALSHEQIRELGNGLEKSGCPFFWVLKAKKLDKEDEHEIVELLGESFLERTRGKGMVVKEWVDQERILAHPAVGGFLSHCGWNSVMETSRIGVPILAWPLHSDQRQNAEVVEKAGLGRLLGDWGWIGEKLVCGEEIGEKVREIMSDEKLRSRAAKLGEQGRMACELFEYRRNWRTEMQRKRVD